MLTRIMKISTGIDVPTTRFSIVLNKYISDIDDSCEYYVQVYDTKTHRLREMTFDDFSTAKRRFLFEAEKAITFTEE